ncbi:hypothetical protein DY000_02019228 [Brassica cretica]|uniref:RNase H type-1 domain-containing protein n=1 Tax=Brassica cretica TaxID=69181 RepID=A0ABQ7CWD6_BRACR|nr:hypothetical protein DY000_02019228 [Brassica cretica]
MSSSAANFAQSAILRRLGRTFCFWDWRNGEFVVRVCIDMNLLAFENRTLSPQEIVLKSIRASKEWEAAQPGNLPNTISPINQRDEAETLLPMTFCNTDAAWKSDTKPAGLGWIFTDNTGRELTRGSSAQSHVSSAMMAEALAVREALIHASSLNLTKICLKTDSQTLVRAITTGRRPSDLFRVLSDVDSLAFLPTSPFVFCRFVFIFRAINGSADSLAKTSLSLYLGPRP